MSCSRRIPKYRHYKPKNLGVVRIEGKDHYLGRYDSPQSWEDYHHKIAEWLSECNSSDPRSHEQQDDAPSHLTINQLLLAYWKFAEQHYVRDCEPTKELDCMRDALRPVRRLSGSSRAADFGPAKLKIIRGHTIDVQDLCRTEVNKRVGRIKRVFNWAVSEELIPASAAHALDTVKGLRKGQTHARESKPIKPVPDSWVEEVLPFLPPTLVAMIRVQRLTGMRPCEVVRMRPCDIDFTDDVWVYHLDRHKNDWRDQQRMIPLGPKCQEILGPFLDRPSEKYLFSPTEAQQWRLDHRAIQMKQNRKTHIYPSELRAREKAKQLRRKNRSRRPEGDHYITTSYRKALNYAFQKAKKVGVEIRSWTPNQLRHTRGTEIRKAFGIEASRIALGHARLETTEIYAEKDLEAAIEIARQMG